MAEPSNRHTGLSQPPAAIEGVVVRLRLIGQMEAWTVRSENVLPSGRKTRALLASIAMAAPRPVLRGRLAEQLWSRRPEEQARASLRQEIHRLLEALAPAETDILTITRDHLTLRPGAVWIDVEEVMRATVAHPASLSLLDGDLLEDLDGVDPNFDAWLNTERERLRDRARAIAEAILKNDLEPEAAIAAAQRLLSIDRTHEGGWRALMRAHAARGERGLAVQAYDRCRATLADMLDAAPSAETQKLLNEIRGPSGSRLPLRPPAPPPPPEAHLEVPAPAPAAPRRTTSSALRGGAHVGVAPLRLVGMPEEDSHLALGLADELTTALSRFRWMFVVSSNSVARFAEEQRDEAAMRRELGLDFLLDGTIQRAGMKIRVSLRLLDLRSANQVVWTNRFDRESDDLLSLQDEIAAEVVAQIDPEILFIEAKRSITRPPVDATAYDLMLRALPLMGRMEHEPFMQAGHYLAEAIKLEPDYAAAHAWYAYWHVFLVGQDWADHPSAMMERAGELAERAIVLDPFDARALTISGHVRAFLHRRLREAMALHERALALNPNLAMAWALSAMTHAYVGDPEEAERRLRRYKKLSPLDPHAFIFDGFFGVIHLMRRDYESAVEVGRDVSLLNPSFSATYRPYLAALGHLRREQEAAIVRRRFLALEPDFTIERFMRNTPMERESDRLHYAEGLRLAGLRERDPPVANAPIMLRPSRGS
ncbi:BTAD domain-containing putative transcriptional regulator [Rhodopila sp.]|jgi:DNA-binding SARP family transcriptional activator/TolB-like protein|uniref:BTAD domain-containing putative transcriptional regulator n=1 Tax=Rhodopila sp. TaxID=2480087 RepID=UPI002B771655|nr:BTAD domain-containing putative transcriptional regulator [Rhodopila sp.]HVZ09086.1 BTAD domain-containing putative transcriptional regulator [Rhodopila sp.]